MKRVLGFLFALLLCATVGLSQSGYRVQHAEGISNVSSSQVSLNNAWFGSSFNYQLTGNQSFKDNFLFNANILYNIKFDSTAWNFPITGNLTLPLTGSKFQDIEVGINPWRVISTKGASTVWVLHGQVSYRVDPQTTASVSPQTFDVLGGVEVSIPVGDSDLPFTVSVTPGVAFNNLDRGTNLFLEGTFIFPIAPNLGLIGEYVWSNIDYADKSRFNAGVLVNGALSNR